MGSFKGSALKELYFSGYKNLTECRIELDQATVIVGANNSGKSNFLEMFDLLSTLHFGGEEKKEAIAYQMVAGEPLQICLMARIEEAEGSVFEVSYKLKMDLVSSEHRPKFKIKSEIFDYKLKSSPGKPKQLFHREEGSLSWRWPADVFKKYDVSSTDPAYAVIKAAPTSDNLNEQAKSLRLYFAFLEYFKTSVFSSHKFAGSYDEEIGKSLVDIHALQESGSKDFEKFKHAFLELLGLHDFRVIRFGGQKDQAGSGIFLGFVYKRESTIPTPTLIDQLSDGSKILFLMLHAVFIVGRPLVCVEEPEIGLHPSAINKLIKLFLGNEVASQVLMSTHSAYLLNLINPKSVFLMEGREDERSTTVPVSEVKDFQARLKGKYVNFGDIFSDNFSPLKSYDLSE